MGEGRLGAGLIIASVGGFASIHELIDNGKGGNESFFFDCDLDLYDVTALLYANFMPASPLLNDPISFPITHFFC